MEDFKLFLELLFTVAVPCLGALWVINKLYEHWRLNQIRKRYHLKWDDDDDILPRRR